MRPCRPAAGREAFGTHASLAPGPLSNGADSVDANLDLGLVPVPTGPVKDYSAIQPFLLPQLRNVNYACVQDEWRFARDWTATAGVRHDHYSDFGGATNPRLALVWDASVDLTAKLLYGRAFRAPSFNESYCINNPVQRGNPNLQPEEIGTAGSGVRMAGGQRSPAQPERVQARAQGNDSRRALRASASYAYQRAIDERSRTDAGYAPRHHFNARLSWLLPGDVSVTPQLNRVAGRRRTAGHTDISISLRNIFNADVREPSLAPGAIPNDLPMARRAVQIRLSATL